MGWPEWCEENAFRAALSGVSDSLWYQMDGRTQPIKFHGTPVLCEGIDVLSRWAVEFRVEQMAFLIEVVGKTIESLIAKLGANEMIGFSID